MSIKSKLLIYVSIVYVLITASIGIYSVSEVKSNLEVSAQEKLKSDVSMTNALLDIMMEGAWLIRDGQLYKGAFLINDSIDFVDLIKVKTGNYMAIYQGDTSIASNIILENGNRAVGIKAPNEVIDKVLKNNEKFYGEVDVVGFKCQASYRAITDENGEILGIIFVGVPNQLYEDMAKDFTWAVSVVIFISLIVFVVLVRFIINRLLGSKINLAK